MPQETTNEICCPWPVAPALLLAGCSHPQPVSCAPAPPPISAGAVYQQGFHDGFEAARHDVAANRPPAFDAHPRFRNPPVPPPAIRSTGGVQRRVHAVSAPVSRSAGLLTTGWGRMRAVLCPHTARLGTVLGETFAEAVACGTKHLLSFAALFQIAVAIACGVWLCTRFESGRTTRQARVSCILRL